MMFFILVAEMVIEMYGIPEVVGSTPKEFGILSFDWSLW